MSGIYAIVIGLCLVVLLLGMLVVGLLRSHAAILRKLDSIGAGMDERGDPSHTLTLSAKPNSADAPRLVGVNPNGEPAVVSPSIGDLPLLIAFLSTSCSSCTVFWEGLNRREMDFGGRRHRILIATLGPDEESPTRAGNLMRGDSDVIMSSQGWEEYGVPGAPYFVVADPSDGIIGEGSAETFDSLVTFLTDSANDRHWDSKTRSNSDRASRIDDELRAAGIRPGDPRLHHRHGEIEPDLDSGRNVD